MCSAVPVSIAVALAIAAAARRTCRQCGELEFDAGIGWSMYSAKAAGGCSPITASK
jgi:hypothetical protein